MSTDTEFAEFLRGQLREIAEEEVAKIEKRHDDERGEYVPHHHHPAFEAARH